MRARIKDEILFISITEMFLRASYDLSQGIQLNERQQLASGIHLIEIQQDNTKIQKKLLVK